MSKKRFLVFDTETTGLPKRFGAQMEDVDNWPRMAQLAFLIVNEDGFVDMDFCKYIKPDGWTIPKLKFFIENGMSTENCEENGIPVFEALREFQEALKTVDYVVAHNLAFDKPIVGAEMIRAGVTPALLKYKKPGICTMLKGVGHGKGHAGMNKWPKLIELHTSLFGEGFDGAHDALADVKATTRCLVEMIRLGSIKIN